MENFKRFGCCARKDPSVKRSLQAIRPFASYISKLRRNKGVTLSVLMKIVQVMNCNIREMMYFVSAGATEAEKWHNTTDLIP